MSTKTWSSWSMRASTFSSGTHNKSWWTTASCSKKGHLRPWKGWGKKSASSKEYSLKYVHATMDCTMRSTTRSWAMRDQLAFLSLTKSSWSVQTWEPSTVTIGKRADPMADSKTVPKITRTIRSHACIYTHWGQSTLWLDSRKASFSSSIFPCLTKTTS